MKYNDFYGHREAVQGIDRVHWDALCASNAQAQRDRDAAQNRLRLNQERLEKAIHTVPGWQTFNGTPESAVGVAAELLENLTSAAVDREGS